MKFAVVTPFSRFNNLQTLVGHLISVGIYQWYPIVNNKILEGMCWPEGWTCPVPYYQDNAVFDICYAK